MSVLKRYDGSNWEIIGMGISQSASELSGVNKILTPAYPSGKSGDVSLDAGDIGFDASAAYPSLTVGNRLQQTISTATPLIADYNTSYYDINNAITNNRIVYVEIDNVRYYFMSKGTTSGMGWIKFVANTGSDINIITYNSDGSKAIDNRNSSSIFWATYGTTDSDTIIASYNAGQLCGVRYNNDVYLLSNIYEVSAGAFEVQFINLEWYNSNKISYKSLICRGNTWNTSSDYIPFESSVNSTLTALKLAMYPVGSIYISSNSTSPASFIGGSWINLGASGYTGYTLVAADPSADSIARFYPGKTGGKLSVALAIDEMPSHRHSIAYYQSEGAGSGWALTRHGTSDNRNASVNLSGYTGGTGASLTSAGTTEAHENMPPYYVVYMWRRTA